MTLAIAELYLRDHIACYFLQNYVATHLNTFIPQKIANYNIRFIEVKL